ncbi:MAG: hypothetical protein ACXABY_29370, partial [Candidatus Thorarchaeota archaeon]
QGIVVQKADRRWQMIVGLRVETAPDTPSDPQKQVKLGPGSVSTGSELPRGVTDPGNAPQGPELYKAPKAPNGTSAQALKASKHFRVPAFIRRFGEASVAALGECVGCGNATPLRYGTESLCPLCARKE